MQIPLDRLAAAISSKIELFPDKHTFQFETVSTQSNQDEIKNIIQRVHYLLLPNWHCFITFHDTGNQTDNLHVKITFYDNHDASLYQTAPSIFDDIIDPDDVPDDILPF